MDEPGIDSGRVAGLCAAALEALARPVFICDREKVLFANAAAARMLRAGSGADLVGVPVNEMLHPDMHAPAAIRRQVLTDSRQQLRGIPAKLLRRDGSVITVLADARPIEYDGGLALLYTCGPACVSEAS